MEKLCAGDIEMKLKYLLLYISLPIILSSCGMEDSTIIRQNLANEKFNINSSPYYVSKYSSTLRCSGNHQICSSYTQKAVDNAHLLSGSYIAKINLISIRDAPKVEIEINTLLEVEDKDSTFGGLGIKSSGSIKFYHEKNRELVYEQPIYRNLPASEHKTNFWGLYGAVDWAVSDAIKKGFEDAANKAPEDFQSKNYLQEKVNKKIENINQGLDLQEKITKTKEKCKKIGFVEGSNDYSNCVMELLK